MTDSIQLLLDDNRGIYIPQNFVDEFKLELLSGINAEDVKTCQAGPEHEWYWDAWDNILNNASYQENGHTFTLHQDGALFGICDELMTDEEYRDYWGEERD